MEDQENFEISTRGLKAHCSASELPVQSGTPYQIRTDTEEILSLLPLPVGLREQYKLKNGTKPAYHRRTLPYYIRQLIR